MRHELANHTNRTHKVAKGGDYVKKQRSEKPTIVSAFGRARYTVRVVVQFTPEQTKQLSREAERTGLKLGTYVRHLALGEVNRPAIEGR